MAGMFDDLIPDNASSAPKSGVGMFDDLIPTEPKEAKSPPEPADGGGALKQFGYGALQMAPNMVTGTADTLEKGIADALLFRNSQTGESMFTQLGRDLGLVKSPAPTAAPYEPKSGKVIKGILDTTGLNPQNLPAPQTASERIANTTGAGVAGALGTVLTGGEAAPAVISTLAKGAAAGAGSGLAMEAVPEGADPKWRTLAGVAGGLGGGLAAETPGLLAKGTRAAADAIPVTTGQVERNAAKRLVAASEDPNALAQSLAAGTPPDLVPGSKPTTGQITGDRGILSMESAAARKNPEAFVARREQQNAARNAAINDLQQTGDPAAVGSFFRSQLDDIDATTQKAVDDATSAAQKAAQGIGGAQIPDVTGGQMRGILESNAPRMTTLGGQQAPELTGAQMRGALEASIAEMKARERALWSAVPKDVNVVSTPMKQTAQSVYGTLTPEVRSTLSPIEREVQSFIGGYGDQLPFERLNGLRQIVSQGMREARSPLQPNEAAYGRLSQVRKSIEDAIDASLNDRNILDQRAVANGTMAAEDTLAANLQRKVDSWKNARSEQQQAMGAGPQANSGARGFQPGRGSGASSAPGAGGAGGAGFGPTAGSAGISGDEARPLIDEAGAAALREANAATKMRKDLTGNQPISGILQRPYVTSPYKIGDAAVPGRIWRPGDTGSQTIVQYLDAARNAPEAVSAVREAAAQSLRDEAVNGYLSQKSFDAWRQKYAAPLNRLEQAAPGTTANFMQSVGQAGDDVRGILTRPDIVNAAIPSMIWKSGAKGSQSVQDFLTSARGDPRAIAALQEAASNSLLSKSKGGVLSEADFQKWKDTHTPALAELERVAPGTLGKFENAATASKAIEDAAAARKTAMDAHAKSALGSLMDVKDPADITKRIGTMLQGKDAVSKMRQLATAAMQDPAALDGLRRAIADHIKNKLVGNTEAGTSGVSTIKSDVFQTFVRQNDAALRQVMTPEQMNSLHAIAADLQRAQRSVSAVKIPGGSDTVQNAQAAAKHAGGMGSSLMSSILNSGVGGIAGYVGGSLMGHTLTGAALGAVLGAVRKAGLARVEDLVQEALLNPELARTLMMKLPTTKGGGISMANRLLRASAIGGIASQQ